jgi:hypothetical protein
MAIIGDQEASNASIESPEPIVISGNLAGGECSGDCDCNCDCDMD